SWDEAVKAGAVDIMQTKYPGLEIIVDPSGGLTKLIAEKDDPVADVSFIDDSAMPRAIALGIAQPLDFSKIPSAADVYEKGKLFGDYGLAMEFGRLGLAYRTDKLSEAPTSWADMWNPEYAGHVSIGTAEAGSTAWVQFLIAAAELGGGGVDNIDPGFEKLTELKPNLLTVTNSTAQVTQLLTDGDLWLTHFWDGRTIQAARDGIPVAFVAPEEGAFATITYVSMISGSKHPDLAHELIDLMLSTAGQRAFGEEIGYGPTNKEVVLPEEMIAEGVLYGSDEVDAMRILDWEALSLKEAEWLERWNDAVL
ncbi:MAG: ABC transporter substrate-binding protein, partial [Thermomicrobiales bacterium]|nr:ABC transporter substrate-binding protein [Thermomicrobiales bacterium]